MQKNINQPAKCLLCFVFSKNERKVYSALNISHDMRKRKLYRRGQMDSNYSKKCIE